jgi:tRNA(Glu) U13 pseudouridine synthase TruD
VRPQDLAWRFDCDPGASELILELTLAAGSYATVLLEELFGAGRLVDGGRLAVRGRDAGPDAAAERS